MFNIMYPSIYPSVYASIYLSMYLSIHLSMHPSTYLSIYLCIYLYIHLSIHLSIHPSIHLSICVSIHLSIYLTVHIQNVSQIRQNTTKDHIKMSLGGHWLNMDPFGVSFGTLRLRLDILWGVLRAFLVSLGVILEILGSILRQLGHLDDPQNAIWTPEVVF